MQNYNFGTTEAVQSIRDLTDNLNLYEKAILFLLSACMGSDNKAWHSVKELARLARMSPSTFKKHYRSLEAKGYIKVKRQPGNSRINNEYSLVLDKIYKDPVDKSEKVRKSRQKMNQKVVNDRAPLPVTAVSSPPSGPSNGSGQGRETATKNNNIKNKKKESPERIRVPLTEFYKPNQKLSELVAKRGISQEVGEVILKKAVDYYAGKLKACWDYAVYKWFEGEKLPTTKVDKVAYQPNRANEPRSTVPWIHEVLKDQKWDYHEANR